MVWDEDQRAIEYMIKPELNRIVVVTVVPSDGEIKKGKLTVDQHQRNVRRWKERLGRAGRWVAITQVLVEAPVRGPQDSAISRGSNTN
jgi:hypothetical protein